MTQLYNESNNTIVSTNVLVADTFFTRLRGLLGKKGLGEGECMIIKPCNSIHTFFMAFPIDAVFVDKQFKVVKIIQDMQPWHTTPFIKGAHSVIELSANVTNDSMTVSIGDQLKIM